MQQAACDVFSHGDSYGKALFWLPDLEVKHGTVMGSASHEGLRVVFSGGRQKAGGHVERREGTEKPSCLMTTRWHEN